MPVVKLERSHRTIVAAEPDPCSTRSHRRSPCAIRSTRSSPPTATGTATLPFPLPLSERAHAILAVRGRRVLFTNGQKTSGAARRGTGRSRNSQGVLVRATSGQVPPDVLGTGSRRQRLQGLPVRDRSGPIPRARPNACRRPARRPLRAARLDRRADGQLAAERALRRATRRHAALPRTDEYRRLSPLRDRGQARGQVHGGGRVNHVAAQIAGAGGALGLAALIVSPRRDVCGSQGSSPGRSAAVRWWSFSHRTGTTGCSPRPPCWRAPVRPAVHGSSCACPGCSRLRRSRVRRHVFRCTSARRRRTCCCRCTPSSPLRPIALAWELFGDDRRVRELGPLAVPLASLRRLAGAVAALDEGRSAGGDRAAVLRPAVRAADRCALAVALVARVGARRCTSSSR